VPGVDVELWDTDHQAARPFRLVRNLSGHAVLLNQPADQDLTFRILPSRTDYRGPALVTFNPALDGVSRVVPLERRPDASFDDVAILVRGWVVRSSGQPNSDALVPVAGLTVSVRPSQGRPGRHFPATTDDNGDFALAVGRPSSADADPLTATLHFAKDGLPVRNLEVNLEAGRVHVFSAPIDLDGTEQPPFTHEKKT
jgi:hypothetical protein